MLISLSFIQVKNKLRIRWMFVDILQLLSSIVQPPPTCSVNTLLYCWNYLLLDVIRLPNFKPHMYSHTEVCSCSFQPSSLFIFILQLPQTTKNTSVSILKWTFQIISLYFIKHLELWALVFIDCNLPSENSQVIWHSLIKFHQTCCTSNIITLTNVSKYLKIP